jgi:hypothetical protein
MTRERLLTGIEAQVDVNRAQGATIIAPRAIPRRPVPTEKSVLVDTLARLVLGRRHDADRTEQPSVVEPVHPGQRGEFDRLVCPLRPVPTENTVPVGSVDVAGVAYGWVFWRTERITASAITHAAVDWIWRLTLQR